MYGRWLRNSFIYLLILVAIVAIVFTVFQGSGSGRVKQELPQFIEQVKADNVQDIKVDDTNVTYKLKDDPDHGYKTELEKGDTLRQVLVDAKVTTLPKYEIKDPSPWTNYLGLLINFLPIIIILAIVFFFLRQAQGSNNQALNFGKSRARMFSGTRPSVTFLDVAGVDDRLDPGALDLGPHPFEGVVDGVTDHGLDQPEIPPMPAPARAHAGMSTRRPSYLRRRPLAAASRARRASRNWSSSSLLA